MLRITLRFHYMSPIVVVVMKKFLVNVKAA